MMNRTVKLTLGLVACLIIFLYVPVSTIFLILLLGLLLVPPVLVFISVFKEGAPIISEELRGFVDSGKNFFVISISKESITLEPQFK